MATIEVAAAAVFNAAEFKLCVAENVVGTAFRNGVVTKTIEIALGNVVVARDEIAVVQFVVVHGVVVAQDAVVRVGVALKFARVENARVEQWNAIGIATHVVGGAQWHERKVKRLC